MRDATPPPPPLDAVVVGAGIAGLVTAYDLLRRGVRCVLVEAGSRAGGLILTERSDGFIVEGGPDSLLAQKPAAIDLCHELGLGADLVPTLTPRRAFVVRHGRLHALPEAGVLGFPARPGPFLRSSLLTRRGRLRMALDLVLARGGHGDDESVGAFVRRRFGEEAVRYVAQPLLAGIHSGDVERLSVRALFPQLVALERQHRSVLLGAFRRGAGPVPDGPFRSLAGGLGGLVDALAGTLPAGALRLDSAVRRVLRREASYDVECEGGTLRGRALVLAVPRWVAARLVAPLDASLASLLDAVPYVSVATITLAYRRRQVAHPLAGSGFVVPTAERPLSITAATWVTSKWPHRAPRDVALLRAFVGGRSGASLLERDDDGLIALAHAQLAQLLSISGAPVRTWVHRWDRAGAQHEVGHLATLARLETHLTSRHPGLFVTGSGYRGTGIADCVADARRTAAAVAHHVRPAADSHDAAAFALHR